MSTEKFLSFSQCLFPTTEKSLTRLLAQTRSSQASPLRDLPKLMLIFLYCTQSYIRQSQDYNILWLSGVCFVPHKGAEWICWHTALWSLEKTPSSFRAFLGYLIITELKLMTLMDKWVGINLLIIRDISLPNLNSCCMYFMLWVWLVCHTDAKVCFTTDFKWSGDRQVICWHRKAPAAKL